MPRKNSFQKLLDFLEYLKHKKYWYRLERIRPETICVCVVIPGEHWEIEFFSDGHILFERFISNAEMGHEAELKQQLALLEEYDKDDTNNTQS